MTSTMNATDQSNNANPPPLRKTVSGMPWIDSDGDTGFYTGDVNSANVPDGMGLMRYDDGPVLKGRWKEGEMVIDEEEEEAKPSPQQSTSASAAAMPRPGSPDLKQQQLQQFHERNQQFLQSQSSQQQQQQQLEQMQLLAAEEAQAETEQLHRELYELQEQVRQLSHELRITRDTHQLNKDQSRAEIEMLHTELDRQNSRHEQIVASLRNRLVESEMARMKMQDQLSARMEEDATREEELKLRWKEMTTRVLEDKKWVDEQMDYWKESMEEHRKRLSGAKVRGGLDAGLGESSSAASGTGASPGTSGSPGERKSGASKSSTESENDRRLCQRKLWGAYDEEEDDDSDSDDQEARRMFGSKSK